MNGGRAIDASDDVDADAIRALDIDPQLAEHAPGPRVATADGGIIDAGDDTEVIHNETGHATPPTMALLPLRRDVLE